MKTTPKKPKAKFCNLAWLEAIDLKLKERGLRVKRHFTMNPKTLTDAMCIGIVLERLDGKATKEPLFYEPK